MNIKKFFNTIFVFLTGNVLSKLVNVFLLPLYTNRLLPAQYGEYDVVVSFINLIAPIAFLQIWDSMFRFAFDYKKDNEKSKVINNTLLVYMLGIVVYFVLFFALYKYYKFDYFGYVFLYGFVFSLQYVYTYSARLHLNNKLFVASGLVHTIVTALLNIYFIVVLGWDIKSMYIASAIGCAVQILIIEAKLHIFAGFRFKDFDRALIKSMIRFSVPLCITTVSYWLFSGFTKMIILEFLGETANGIYAVANRFAYMVTMVVSVFQFAWNESAYLMGQDDNHKERYKICFDIIIKCVACGLACLMLVVKVFFPILVAEQYREALMFVPITMFGVAMSALASFIATFFMTEKKTGGILASSLIAAAANVVLGTVLTRYYGLFGATLALSFSFLIMVFIRAHGFAKLFEVMLVKKYLYMFSMIFSAVAVFYCIDSVFINLIFCGILCLVFCISMRKYLRIFIRK